MAEVFKLLYMMQEAHFYVGKGNKIFQRSPNILNKNGSQHPLLMGDPYKLLQPSSEACLQKENQFLSYFCWV